MAGTTSDKLAWLKQIKEAFRTAITGKGQTITDNEPFSAWPAKVTAIQTGTDTSDATAIASDMAEGVTAYVNGEKVTGTLPENTGSQSFFNSTPRFTKETGMFNLINEVTEDQILRTGAKLYFAMSTQEFGDATAEDVAAGKTFTSKNGLKVTGTGSVSSGRS